MQTVTLNGAGTRIRVRLADPKVPTTFAVVTDKTKIVNVKTNTDIKYAA